jgi:hypothetical protein
MGGIIRGDVVDSTDVYAPKPEDQQKIEEERRRREAEEAKKKTESK